LERLQAIIYATILDDKQTLGDPAHIQSILDFSLQLRPKLNQEYGGKIRTWKDLRHTFTRAVQTQNKVIDIIISFSSLYQDPNFKHKVIHWDHFSLTPYDEDRPKITQPPTTAPPSVVAVTTEVTKTLATKQAPASKMAAATPMTYQGLTINPSTLFVATPPAAVTTKEMLYDLSSSAADAHCSGVPTKNHCTPIVETLSDDDPGTLRTRNFCVLLNDFWGVK